MKSVLTPEGTVSPSKILCIGRNYVDHIHELGNEVPEDMVVFLKPNSALSDTLNSHHLEDVLHFETELCFMFEQGRFSHVGIGLDLTKRELQNKLKAKGLPWEKAKAFDGAALFSPFVAIKDASMPFEFELKINGETTQLGHADLMIYSPATILTELQSIFSLEDGDIVMTGTPKGVGVIPANTLFEVSLRGGETKAPLLEWQWQSN
ncbi:fumarylacetoacetate hydrolase family protein [Shewanella acanthi]|uniref:fumarylacetoacetate hydrolase family protein n=1 Tax=Shewanella acanthi TaxID=2864212 RepID=UPI001C65AD80|nr:fumarylacetoacetate hydrolase family protein [Shewanella acanthi]QYJ77841.1 fumarylacetoacetate hydrolase family protein [Shewanella acanthi]